jgi:hypothetical protein
MADIIIFDSNDLIVPNRVLQYLKSVNTPDYSGDILINPNINNVKDISINYWKVVNLVVEEMTTEEKNTVDNFLKADQTPFKNYLIKQYNSSKILISETWYEKDNGDGTYSVKAEEKLYIYSNRILESYTLNIYSYNGNIINTEKWDYYNDINRNIEKRIVEE